MTTLRPGKRPPDDRYINREELRELIPVTDMTIARWRRNPAVAFPAPVKLGIGAAARNYWWLQRYPRVDATAGGSPAARAGSLAQKGPAVSDGAPIFVRLDEPAFRKLVRGETVQHETMCGEQVCVTLADIG